MIPIAAGLCPLCNSRNLSGYAEDSFREYLVCVECGLVFVPPAQHIGVAAERERYDLHSNTINDTGYVAYLGGVADLVAGLGVKDPAVLDFGCGAHAVLGGILSAKGIRCDSYDPLYGIGTDCLEKQYDVVVLCEVIEHLRNLRDELKVISRLTKAGGFVIIKTQPVPEKGVFTGWWYKQDLTHIHFFGNQSLKCVADLLHGGDLFQSGSDVWVIRKNGEAINEL